MIYHFQGAIVCKRCLIEGVRAATVSIFMSTTHNSVQVSEQAFFKHCLDFL